MQRLKYTLISLTIIATFQHIPQVDTGDFGEGAHMWLPVQDLTVFLLFDGSFRGYGRDGGQVCDLDHVYLIYRRLGQI